MEEASFTSSLPGKELALPTQKTACNYHDRRAIIMTGLLGEAHTETQHAEAPAGARAVQHATTTDMGIKEHFWNMWQCPQFTALSVAFFLCGITTTGFIETHLVKLAVHNDFSLLTGSLAFSSEFIRLCGKI